MISPARAAAEAKRALRKMAKPTGVFDARRYFRGDITLGFYNVGTGRVRAMARTVHRVNRHEWSPADATAFAEVLIEDRHLEVKNLGIELLACYRGVWTAQSLRVRKRWLAGNHASNWATTDAICSYLIGPLIAARPALAAAVATWARHRSLWVRRAAAAGLIPAVRKGIAVDVAYDVARMLHTDREDLIQKAAGWLLREAGKADPRRLERYLRRHGPSIPRITVRYAIERLPETRRRALLAATRGADGH